MRRRRCTVPAPTRKISSARAAERVQQILYTDQTALRFRRHFSEFDHFTRAHGNLLQPFRCEWDTCFPGSASNLRYRTAHCQRGVRDSFGSNEFAEVTQEMECHTCQ